MTELFDINRPFTRADAVRAGISPSRLGSSRFRRIFRGVMISTKVKQTREERMVGALLLHPDDARLSHSSAAEWWGVIVPKTSIVHVSVHDPADRRWRPGLKPHVSPPHVRAVVHRGVRVSDRIRMFVELASMLDLVDLVVAGDNILRVFGMSADQLVNALHPVTDYWAAGARHAASFVRDEVDSPMETRLRMLIVLAGLPEPKVNLKLRNEHGDVVVRFDLSYPDLRLAIEYDGRQHVEVMANWENDEERREFLDDIEWRILKVRAHGIYVDPGATVERVWHGLRKRGRSVPVPRDDWRAHFPGRTAAA